MLFQLSFVCLVTSDLSFYVTRHFFALYLLPLFIFCCSTETQAAMPHPDIPRLFRQPRDFSCRLRSFLTLIAPRSYRQRSRNYFSRR
ncbi:hypothetical protein V8C35DRAFT_287253 [Trichoderma chlorosporum]